MSTELVNTIGTLLKEKNYIGEAVAVQDSGKPLDINLEDYIRKHPVRKHRRHWIDGGDQIGGVQPETVLPFFINPAGSQICRLCDGRHSTGEIFQEMKKIWGSLPEKTLITNVMSFLLLLEELDLIEFAR
ncbi:MAG: hypothetical protein WCB46_04345 [Methanoregula sp.]